MSSSLSQHATRLSQDILRVKTAQEARSAELHGPRPWWVRWWDALSTTPAELTLEQAETALQTTRQQARRALGDWLEAMERDYLLSPAATTPRALHQAWVHTRTRASALSAALARAQRAVSSLRDAAAECSEASSMETLDLVSSNQAISQLSTYATSSASDAVEKARSNLALLRETLSSVRLPSNQILEVPSDLTDLMVDFALPDIGFDVFSFMNISALEESEESCNQAVSALVPLVDRLTSVVHRADHAASRAQTAFDQYMLPQRALWKNEVPVSVLALLDDVSLSS